MLKVPFFSKTNEDEYIRARLTINAILIYCRTRFPWVQLHIPTVLPLSEFLLSYRTTFLSSTPPHCITSLRILYYFGPWLNWNGEGRIKNPHAYFKIVSFLSELSVITGMVWIVRCRLKVYYSSCLVKHRTLIHINKSIFLSFLCPLELNFLLPCPLSF